MQTLKHPDKTVKPEDISCVLVGAVYW